MPISSKLRLPLIISAILIVVLVIWIVHRKTSSRLTPERFAQVYVELSIAYEACGSDVAKWHIEKARILKEHNLSTEEIKRFITKYNQNPSEWVLLWERIVNRLHQEQQHLANPAPLP
ncbi:MAG TPA: hypothetical protein VGB16_02220 [candidate division Zixibacteria bacterium]